MSRYLMYGLLLALAGSALADQDPTRPSDGGGTPAALQQGETELVLQAIVRRPGYARAVLNGQSLAVDDVLAGARLLDIRASSVVIEREGQRSVLHLAQPIVKPSR